MESRWGGKVAEMADQEGTHGKGDVPQDLNNNEPTKQKSGPSISGSKNDDDDRASTHRAFTLSLLPVLFCLTLPTTHSG